MMMLLVLVLGLARNIVYVLHVSTLCTKILRCPGNSFSLCFFRLFRFANLPLVPAVQSLDNVIYGTNRHLGEKNYGNQLKLIHWIKIYSAFTHSIRTA